MNRIPKKLLIIVGAVIITAIIIFFTQSSSKTGSNNGLSTYQQTDFSIQYPKDLTTTNTIDGVLFKSNDEKITDTFTVGKYTAISKTITLDYLNQLFAEGDGQKIKTLTINDNKAFELTNNQDKTTTSYYIEGGGAIWKITFIIGEDGSEIAKHQNKIVNSFELNKETAEY